ncbi:coiled-coil and C2 domain-containing protein 1-like isoform X1 [Neodiprion virginianus]|uniref:coiled-coil and C2 domain-containing protein 1-like isoform X1 n=1 Tax=Neodiprion virginianus TaxID=2961670 RepID=UPI001EE6E3DB|nr:coiled-coil and C2 domain-containing protein 1-like isoform X1 [Neodiprion virginianus]
MFGAKKETKRRTRPAGRDGGLAQYGLFDVPGQIDSFDGMNDLGDDDDEDFEAELAALTSGNDKTPERRKDAPKVLPSARLDVMVAESMKDIGDDEELSGDDDDPDLLNELHELTGEDPTALSTPEHEQERPVAEANETETEATVKLLEERLASYKVAVIKAKAENEPGRVRRFSRGLKTLEEMLVGAKHGHPINTADVPPLLPPSATGPITKEELPADSTPIPEATPVAPDAAPAAVPAPPAEKAEETLRLLKERQREYQLAAVAWKKAGNTDEAIKLVRISKQFDIVVEALGAGDPIDLSDMPPTPTLPTNTAPDSAPPATAGKEDSEAQNDPPPKASSPVSVSSGGDVLGSALKERLEVYRRMKVTAETDGKGAKVRMYGRLCKQFEEAIKIHERGKPIDLEDLPTPPGFPPLGTLVGNTSPPKAAAEPGPGSEPIPEPEPSEEADPRSTPQRKAPAPPPRTKPAMPQRQGRTRADKQLSELQMRQHELKQAALTAKKDGDIELARTYLRQAKGMEPLIQASIGGLPVDMNSVPLSPLAKLRLNELNDPDSFVVVASEDSVAIEGDGDDQQIYENMEKQLVKHIKTCLASRDHSKAIGDVAGYNRWERMALGYTRDLDMLRVKRRDGLPPPVHHYETKSFAIVQCCTDLGDNDIEITIARGVNYPREADTYVMFKFPYPSENPPSDRTSTVRDSNNPEYEAVFPLSGALDRTARQCQRVFKRHSLKCEVWAKGCSLNPVLCCTHPRGFFRSDSLLGTVTVKLHPLETKCILHDTFPLMDGRKPAGGKLEVKIRVRNPILTKQVEQVTDKWLVIDH